MRLGDLLHVQEWIICVGGGGGGGGLVRSGWCVGLKTLPYSCAESFKLLEFSGPVQTCIGIALPYFGTW